MDLALRCCSSQNTIYIGADPSDNKIGESLDVAVSPDGHVSTLIVGVGGFRGAGEKDVALPFSVVKHTMKDKNLSHHGYD